MSTIYRIVSAGDWDAAQKAGVFRGSAHDIRDGFIHFSTSVQVAETAARHYASQLDLLLLYVESEKLLQPLRWEAARDGALFPHLYGPLPVAAVYRVDKLTLDTNGRHIFSNLIP